MRPSSRTEALLAAAPAAAAAAAGLALALLGAVDTNEGWYWNDALALSRGGLPYRDFFYHRFPLLPVLHAPVAALFGPSLLAGRLWAGLLAAACAAAAALLARRWGGTRAAAWAGAVLLASPGLLYFLATVQSYAPVALLYLAAVWALARDPSSRGWTRAGVCLGLALSFRYALDYPLPVFIACAFLVLGRAAGRPVLAALAAWAASSVPFLLAAPGKALYQTVSWNMALDGHLRALGVLAPSSALADLKARAVFLRDLAVHFPAASAALAAAAAAGLAAWGRAAGAEGEGPGAAWRGGLALARREPARFLAAGLCAGNFAFYLAAPGSAYMQSAFVLPLAGALAAAAWAPALSGARAAAAAAALALAGAANPPPFARSWDGSDLAAVRRTGAALAEASPAGSEVLTLTPAFAAEAGRRLPRGLEMELYSFWPELGEEEARARGLMSAEGLLRLIEEGRPAAVALEERRYRASGARRTLTAVLAPHRETLDAALRRRYRTWRVVEGRAYRGAVEILVPREAGGGS